MVSDLVLDTLSPLLTGMSKNRHHNQPARVIHQSLRDFVVVRAGNSQEYSRFRVDERNHSQDLALRCLRLLNRELRENLPCVGFLEKDESELPGVPVISDGMISEALGYACRFWIDHILDHNSAPSTELQVELVLFMESKSVLWVEVMAARGAHRGLSEVQEWIKVSLMYIPRRHCIVHQQTIRRGLNPLK